MDDGADRHRGQSGRDTQPGWRHELECESCDQAQDADDERRRHGSVPGWKVATTYSEGEGRQD